MIILLYNNLCFLGGGAAGGRKKRVRRLQPITLKDDGIVIS